MHNDDFPQSLYGVTQQDRNFSKQHLERAIIAAAHQPVADLCMTWQAYVILGNLTQPLGFLYDWLWVL